MLSTLASGITSAHGFLLWQVYDPGRLEDGLFRRLISVDERGRWLAHYGQMRCAMHRYARRVFGAMPARRELNTFKWTL